MQYSIWFTHHCKQSVPHVFACIRPHARYTIATWRPFRCVSRLRHGHLRQRSGEFIARRVMLLEEVLHPCDRRGYETVRNCVFVTEGDMRVWGSMFSLIEGEVRLWGRVFYERKGEKSKKYVYLRCRSIKDYNFVTDGYIRVCGSMLSMIEREMRWEVFSYERKEDESMRGYVFVMEREMTIYEHTLMREKGRKYEKV